VKFREDVCELASALGSIQECAPSSPSLPLSSIFILLFPPFPSAGGSCALPRFLLTFYNSGCRERERKRERKRERGEGRDRDGEIARAKGASERNYGGWYTIAADRSECGLIHVSRDSKFQGLPMIFLHLRVRGGRGRGGTKGSLAMERSRSLAVNLRYSRRFRYAAQRVENGLITIHREQYLIRFETAKFVRSIAYCSRAGKLFITFISEATRFARSRRESQRRESRVERITE